MRDQTLSSTIKELPRDYKNEGNKVVTSADKPKGTHRSKGEETSNLYHFV